MHADLIEALTVHEVIVLEGCDGTGKTNLAEALRDQRCYTVTHSGRAREGTDLAARYRQILAAPGRMVLDRSFISELVYGPLFHGRSRITLPAAISLATLVAERGGALVHLTGDPEVIATRLMSRDGNAPPPNRLRDIIDAYHTAFRLLDGTATIITIDATSSSPAT
jgi:thymidylate kinase